MILPETSSYVLALAVLSLLLLGSWASLFRAAGKWRYELCYFDFVFGVVIAMLICSLTFDNLGFDGFSFLDDIQKAGKRQWMYALLAGGIFNLGNMLLIAAVSVAGLSVAFPIAVGAAVLLGVGMGTVVNAGGNSMMLMLGCVLIVSALSMAALAYRITAVLLHEQKARAGKTKSTRRPSAIKGIALAAVGGLLMGSVGGLLNLARAGDLGMGPYATAGLFAVGMFFSTFVYNIFLMNLPVEGEPLDLSAFFAGKPGQHLKGVGAGVLWYCGMLAALVVAAVPDTVRPAPPIGVALRYGYPLVAALIGIVLLRETKAGDMRVKVLLTLMLVLFACGLGLIGISAPVKG